MTGFPMTMTSWDRTYVPPRAIRASVPVNSTAWDLLRLEQTADRHVGNWATDTVDSLLASADVLIADALGCTDCQDTGFYGVTDPDDPDMLTGLVRRTGEDAHQALQTCGAWDDWDPKGVPLEVLPLDLAGDLAAAITGGACGLVRRYLMPRAFLPPCPVLSAASLSDALTSLVSPQPPGIPEDSDNDWITYAVVDELDPGAVLDLVRIRAAGTPQLERWNEGSWTPDGDLLTQVDLPTVRLSEVQLADVQEQLNPSAIVAGVPGIGRPGAAERLRRYWTTGKGGAKVRWNTPGDATRCHRYLEKYMPGRAWGYCQLLHHKMDGVYTGDRRNPGGNGHRGHHLLSGGITSPVGLLVAGNTESLPTGFVPHIFRLGEVVEFVPTETTAAEVSTLVDVLGGQFEVCGVDVSSVIAEVTAGAGGVQVMKNVVDLMSVRNGPDVDDPARTVGQAGSEPLGGVSVAVPVDGTDPPPLTVRQNVIVRLELQATDADELRRATKSVVVPVAQSATESARDTITVVAAAGHKVYCTQSTCEYAHRAFAVPEMAIWAGLHTGGWARESGRNALMASAELHDGIYAEADQENVGLLQTLTAGAFPVDPPDEWYENPKLTGPTPLTIEDSGRVYGHIATFDVAHIGYPGQSLKAPRSASGYAYFQTGSLKTASGKIVNVGQITLAGGHAPMTADAASAVKHYDDTNSGAADITCGEDRFGIWAAGSLRPTITPEQVRALRASAPSGDWRNVNGNLELVAICQVPVPGFPVTRARVASGAVLALVAAGARPLAEQRLVLMADAALLARLDLLEEKVEQLGTPATAELVAAEPVVAAPEAEAAVVETPPATPVVDPEPVVAQIPETPAPPEPELPSLTAEQAARAEHISQVRAEVAAMRKEQLRARMNGTTAAGLPPQFAKKGDKAEASGPTDVPALKAAIKAAAPSDRKKLTAAAFRLKRPDLIPPSWKKAS